MVRLAVVQLLGLALSGGCPPRFCLAQATQTTDGEREHSRRFSAAEFSALSASLSEEEGYFRSDNFTSNETAYLHIVDRLRSMNVSGGAYIGVGPEQNFTYIAKIRPQIAFIVDIRRQAVIQHLLYKAVFRISENRAQFLSHLLSRPLASNGSPGPGVTVERLLDYFRSPPAPAQTYAGNLARVRDIIQQEFRFPLSEKDKKMLDYVYSMFHRAGLEISFRSGAASLGGLYGGFPSLGDLVVERDLNGNLGNFLAGDEDYRFVRNLQQQNRVIPVVGDFAGAKALAGVGNYLKNSRYTVRAFYTSNVEQFLFQNGVFSQFVENVRKLPIDDNSVIIRSVSRRGRPHPASVPGHRNTTLMQKISVMLRDFDKGGYDSYTTLVNDNFISAQLP
jgi:hypothetical protein